MPNQNLHQKEESIEESFYNVNYGSSIIMSKVRQKISVIKTNTCEDITKIVDFGILIHVLS